VESGEEVASENFHIDGVKKLAKQLDPFLLRKALNRSLNRTTTTAIALAVREVTKTYNIKAGTMKSLIRSRKSAFENLEVIITITSAPTPLYFFGAKVVKVRKRPRNSKKVRTYYGASAKVKKQGRRKKYKHAFIAKVGKQPGIYVRTTEKRLPIRQLKVISPTTMFKIHGKEKIEETFNRVFVARAMHDYKYYLEKAGGGT
jgi:hypothetical protein